MYSEFPTQSKWDKQYKYIKPTYFINDLIPQIEIILIIEVSRVGWWRIVSISSKNDRKENGLNLKSGVSRKLEQ